MVNAYRAIASCPSLLAAALLATAPGCDTEPTPEEREATYRRAQEVARAVTHPSAAAASVALAFEGSAAAGQIEDDALDTLAPTPGCAELTWAGLTATLAFDACVIPSNATVVDGVVTLALSLNPAGISFTFDELTIGDDAFDGQIVVTLDHSGLLVLGDFAYAHDANALEIDDLRVRAGGSGLAIDVAGSLQTPGSATSVTADDIWFPTGVCLPTAGTIDFADPTVQGTVRFLPETPTTGVVAVSAFGLPPTQLEVFTPCT